MDDTPEVKKKRKSYPQKAPPPRDAALARAVRRALGISLTQAASVVKRNWVTVGNFETSTHTIGPETERRLLLFYLSKFVELGVRVESPPEEISLPDLRLLLARTLYAQQAQSVTQHAGVMAGASEASGRGQGDFIDKVVEAAFAGPTRRADSVGVDARVRRRIEEEDAKVAAAAGGR